MWLTVAPALRASDACGSPSRSRLRRVLFTLVFRVFADDGAGLGDDVLQRPDSRDRHRHAAAARGAGVRHDGVRRRGGRRNARSICSSSRFRAGRCCARSSSWRCCRPWRCRCRRSCCPWFVLSAPDVSGRAASAYVVGRRDGRALLLRAVRRCSAITSKRARRGRTAVRHLDRGHRVAQRSPASSRQRPRVRVGVRAGRERGSRSRRRRACPRARRARMGVVMFACAIGWTAYRLVRYEVAERM